jgi:DNA-3-methyladenine glycosylase II
MQLTYKLHKLLPQFENKMAKVTWDLQDAYKILKKDPILRKVIRKTGEFPHGKHKDIYFALLRSITSQQLSAKAGDTIFGRFLNLFSDEDPQPERLIKMKVEKLREAGLSYAKAGYLKNIAEYALTHGFEYRKLSKLSDEELIAYLTAIKGVGKWTAEMILMFTMNRPDILPLDDVGIRNAMKDLYGLKGDGRKLLLEMEETASLWRPYRTLACRHLWRYRDS